MQLLNSSKTSHVQSFSIIFTSFLLNYVLNRPSFLASFPRDLAKSLVALGYMARTIQRQAFFLDTFQGFTYPEAMKSSEVGFGGTHRVWQTAELAVEAIREKLQKVAEAWRKVLEP